MRNKKLRSQYLSKIAYKSFGVKSEQDLIINFTANARYLYLPYVF